VALVGSKSDSDNGALLESFSGHYTTGLTERKDPWRNVEHVEWATLNNVDWFKNRRVHETLNDASPVKFESRYDDHYD
jgi:putative transposase